MKRGEELRDHMLRTAKDVFLELGFERASMDVIAERAGTTKRTLYAHFENKEKLFLAVIELVRGMLLDRLKTPAEYSKDAREAIVRFCASFLEVLIWSRSVRMYRLSIAETERFPEGAVVLYEATFETAQTRLEHFLRERLRLAPSEAKRVATALFGRVLYPRFIRALFGIDELTDDRLSDDDVRNHLDLKPIRAAVDEVVPQAHRKK